MSKSVLGTTQFGIKNYGISNFSKKKIINSNIIEILNYAWNSGIRYYDTAPSYNSEKILGKFIKNRKISKKINIITKVSKINRKKPIKEQIRKSIIKSLNSLGVNKIFTLLFHNQFDYFLISKEKKLFELLKKEFNIKYIGFSVYDLNIAKKILRLFPNSSFQFPYNIFNSNFKKFNKAKKKNIFIGRSIFNQGLLVSKKIKSINQSLIKSHKRYFEFINKNNLNPVEICYRFANLNKSLDYIVYGVTSLDELKEIISYKNRRNKLKLLNKLKFFFKKKDIDPRNCK